MKFNSIYHPELTASKDESRFIINHVFADVCDQGAVIVSTNGRMLAVVPAEFESIHEVGLVPVEAILQARKNKARKPKAGRKRRRAWTPPEPKKESFVELAVNGKIEVKARGVTHQYERPEGDYPRWTNLPEVKSRPAVKFRIALNPAYLLALAKTIGAGDSVILECADETNCIHVKPGASTNSAYGLLMPMRIQ